MAKSKPRMTAKQQQEAFDREAKKRLDAGLPSAAESDDALDAMIRKSIRDHGA